MDTSKAIGIVVANPEFSDIRSLEGVLPQRIRLFRFLPFPQPQAQPLRLP